MPGAIDFMARDGARLVDNGYPVIPIWPGTKKPGRFHRGGWRDYPGWTRHCDRPTTPNEVEVWAKWPEAAIGFACGRIVGIDIDVLDGDLAHRLEALARDRLGDTPLLRIGRAPKRLLVYRAETPFAGPKRSPLEILARGRQFVAFAIHPDTGRPYEWPEESPLSVALDALPAVTEEAVTAWLDAAQALLPDDLKPAILPVNGNGHHATAHSLAGTRDAVREALAFIPNADLDYDSWVRIGMALKGALGEDGTDLFAAWSAQSGKNVPETTVKTWAGFKPDRIGAGSIYHHAMANGWKPDPALVLDGTAPRDPVHPAARLLARVQAAPAADDRAPSVPSAAIMPFDLAIPGGVLGEMVGYMLETSRRRQPILALGASLCALGALMGRKYRTGSNLRTNLYVVSLAGSGSGKNHAREVVNELLVDAGLGAWLGGNKVASGAGLLTAVHRQPALLLQIDEFGMFIEAAADRKRSPRHVAEILENMLELFSAAGGVFLGAEYANRDGKDQRRDINQPCLCIHGTTTAHTFWRALQSANVLDGSLARFIVLRTDEDYPEENLEAGIRRSPPALLESLRRIAAGGGRVPAGNLAGMTSDSATAVDPLTVAMDEGAREAFRDLSRDITRRLRETRDTPFTALLARIGENAAKVALVRAVSLDPASPVIRLEDARWAIDFVRHFAERTIVDIGRHVADNDTERNHKKVLEIVRQMGPAGLTKNDLIRRTQFLDKRQRDDLIATLVEAGLVETAMRTTSTKPAMTYRAADRSVP